MNPNNMEIILGWLVTVSISGVALVVAIQIFKALT